MLRTALAIRPIGLASACFCGRALDVAQGLFRSAQHKKQAEFLGRPFDDEKNRAAAAKNAFVLLAQHRPQLAAAFFILGTLALLAAIEHWPVYSHDTLPIKKPSVWAARSRPGMPVAAGGHLKDAVGVCARELADPQLAIFVARLLEPQQSGLLSDLLANELLPRGPPLLHLCKTHLIEGATDLQD